MQQYPVGSTSMYKTRYLHWVAFTCSTVHVPVQYQYSTSTAILLTNDTQITVLHQYCRPYW